jgi:ribonuclease HI
MKIFTDGGCSNNDQLDQTKRRMVAVVTDSQGNVLVERVKSGSGSNNIAELWAIQLGMEWARQHGNHELHISTDSRNNLAWTFGKIGKKLNDRSAVLALREQIDEFRLDIELELLWVPRKQNMAGHYIDRKDSL